MKKEEHTLSKKNTRIREPCQGKFLPSAGRGKEKSQTAKTDFLRLMQNDTLFQVDRLSKRLKLSESTIYRLIEEGKLKVVWVSKRAVRVLGKSVNEYLRSMNPKFF